MMVSNIKQVEILAEKECWCLLMRKFESIFLSFKTDMLCDKQYSYSTKTVVMCLYYRSSKNQLVARKMWVQTRYKQGLHCKL